VPTPQPSRPRSTVRRRVVAATTERLPLKLAALFFALVLWLVVSAEEAAEELVPVRVVLVPLDSSVQLASPLPQVRALIVGSGRELLKLYATPPTMRRVVGRNPPDTLTLELRPQDIDLPPGVEARVRDVQPRAIPLQFETIVQRMVPVRSALRVSADENIRVLGAPRFEPDSVRVTGPRRLVASVGSVPTAPLELVIRDGAPQTVPLDTARLGVRVTPVSVAVRVPVTRADTSRASLTDTSSRAARGPSP